jgi:limonene-1,2-epoxide hydrolase
MGDSPESVARRFYAAWAEPTPDELRGFFHHDAVWVDGPQGVRHGADAIVSELRTQLNAVGGVNAELKTLLSDGGGTVMVEHLDTFHIGGDPIDAVVMAVLEIDGDGRITQIREAYDLKSTIDKMKAAGFGA